MTEHPALDLPRTLAEARRLLDEQDLSTALDLLEDCGPPGDLPRAHALLGLERFDETAATLAPLLDDGSASAARAEARLLRARLLRRASSLVDEGLELALGAAADARCEPELAADAHLEAAYLFCRKRCAALAARELDRAEACLPRDPRVLAGRAWVDVYLDRRPDAGRGFAAALEAARAASGRAALLGRRAARLGLAHLSILEGDFDAAHRRLDEDGPLPAGDLLARRLRLRALLSQGRFRDVVGVLDELRAASPRSDLARRDAHERAAALYRAGDVDEARAAFAELARGDDGIARSARRLVRLLEREGAAGLPRRRVRQFPTVVQLRDHCGPAACELYLRFFGVPAAQLEIAREIKFPDGGTPVYRLRRFLEKAGFHVRRVEADLPQVKRLIDAGLPVIMEEEYSDSRHVAVAIGYDDTREVLEVQDPMTHEVRETPYEELARLGALSNHGGLVAVPAGDAERRAALDASGAVECRYLALTDEAWAAHDEGRLDDGDRRCDEALALRRDYEIAWLYRFRRARARATEQRGPESRAALHGVLDEVNRLWPDDEWPQQLAGEVLYFEDRIEEALACFRRARDRDPPDAHNWGWIADCLLTLGRDGDAWDALVQTLLRRPDHVRGNENLAHLALRRGRRELAWILNDAARELHPRNPFNHMVHARLLADAGELEAAVAALDRALELDPDRVDDAIERARHLARLGRLDEATDSLARRLEARPDDTGLRVELADLLYNGGRHAAAADVALAIVERTPAVAAGHALLGAARLAQPGQEEAGLASLRQALALSPTYAWVHTQIGRHHAAGGRHAEAIQALAAAVGLARNPRTLYDLGVALAAADHPRPAAPYVASAAVDGRLDERQLERVGEIVAAAGWDVGEVFDDVLRQRPGDPAVLRAQARTFLEVLWAPVAAEPVLARLRDVAPDDPYALAARGAERMDRSLADEDAGEADLRRAIDLAPALEYPRRALAERLVERGRHEEALEVLAPTRDAYTNVLHRVRALLGLSRLEEADAAIAAFERADPERRATGTLTLRYHEARRRRDFAEALRLAEAIGQRHGERDDDGRLDSWEEDKFECLLRLGEVERAVRFGERQAGTAVELGRLAYQALSAERLDVAEQLAERALRLDPAEAHALAVRARSRELAGDADGARRVWAEVGAASPDWHTWHENLARLHLGAGDLEGAAREAAAAVTEGGHLCPWAFAIRAQARLAAGDRDGAAADVERAWRLAKPEDREHEGQDAWAVRALLAGDGPGARALVDAYLEGPSPVSALDRARVGRLVELASAPRA